MIKRIELLKLSSNLITIKKLHFNAVFTEKNLTLNSDALAHQAYKKTTINGYLLGITK